MLFEFDIKEALLGEPERWYGVNVYAKKGDRLKNTVVTTVPPEYVCVGQIVEVKDNGRVLVRVEATIAPDSEIPHPDAGFRFVK